jgi:hypothetical protein
LKENFDYIGGFRNRKNHEYHSYADALKNFEMKMASVNEAYGNKKPILESWNLDKKEELTLEATENMKREIARQRQIMGNASLIESKKNYNVVLNEACNKVNGECAATQKNNIKNDKGQTGSPEGQGGDPFTEDPEAEFKKTQKQNLKGAKKPVAHNVGVTKESKEPLAWNRNADYMDTSNGTEIGSGAPFNKPLKSEDEMDNATVEEGKAIHNTDDLSGAGTGKVGDSAPFNKKPKNGGLNEEDEDLLGSDDVEDNDTDDSFSADGGEDDFGDEGENFGDEEEDFGDEEEGPDYEIELNDDEESDDNDDVESRLSSLEDILTKIADKLGVDTFDDNEPLYGDDSEDEDEEDFGDEGDDLPEDDDDDYEVYESRNYKRMKRINEDRLNYFGKHPAYRKSPMTLPTSQHQEKPGYYDMNDDSVRSEQPYGEKIGSSAPFEINPEEIENAISEAIRRTLKKKI